MRLTVFAAVLALPLCAGEPPATMTKIVVRLTGPGIKPGSSAALPKTIYRAGPHFARIEDPPDARQKVQKLTIIAEPDAYSVNLIDKKGSHATDQGGPDDIHLPVILPFDPNHLLEKLDGLEFGNELHFFQNAGATRQAGPIINAKPTDAYTLTTAAGWIKLVTRSGTHEPVFVSWRTQDGTYKYEYIVYRELPFDPSLFVKPPGIEYREIPPVPSAEQGE